MQRRLLPMPGMNPTNNPNIKGYMENIKTHSPI
jgi:hypothetical protein